MTLGFQPAIQTILLKPLVKTLPDTNKQIDPETPPERWALFYLSALLTTVLATWIGVRYGFFAGALDTSIWPKLLVETKVVSLLIMAIYVLLLSPIVFVFLLILYPARRYVFGPKLRLPRVFILVLLAMAALFLGFLSIGYNPRILEGLPEYIPGLLIASLGYTLLLWLLFILLKRLVPAKAPRPIPEVFD